ncbi:MAG TPA: 3-isopropylmalate dehydrogenase [Planctomycetota bacterium]|jgi:3-isopropylmalate dehydrogenase
MNFHIVVIPGDGIGPEIVAEAQRVLSRVGELFGHRFEYETQLAGGAAIDRFGTPLPEHTLKACQSAQAVLKGPFGGPRWDKLDNPNRPEAGILNLRKGLELFANLRPVKLYEALKDASTLKPQVIHGTDMIIVRELISGIYFGEPRGIFGEGAQRYGVNTEVYHTSEVDRIVRLAFELARTRRLKVTSVDKFNVLESSRLWHDVASDVALQYPDVTLEHQIVDNTAMQLIKDPKQFDVLVTTNLFGDILSDEASMLTGSLGMFPSACIGGKVAMYEPSHGSAPDITGTGKANPLATILSAAMMLKHSFHLDAEARAIDNAVEKALNAGLRTADLAHTGDRIVSCSEMGVAIEREIATR